MEPAHVGQDDHPRPAWVSPRAPRRREAGAVRGGEQQVTQRPSRRPRSGRWGVSSRGRSTWEPPGATVAPASWYHRPRGRRQAGLSRSSVTRPGRVTARSDNVSRSDAIELVPSHGRRGRPEVARPVLGGAEILVEAVPALAEEAAGRWRLEPKGPALARGLEGCEQPARAVERGRIVEDGPMDVREDDLAGRHCPRTPAERVVDGAVREIVGHALPYEEGGPALVVSRCRQRGLDRVPVEVRGGEADPRGWRADDVSDDLALPCLGRRVIDLEAGQAFAARQAVGPGVEPAPSRTICRTPSAMAAPTRSSMSRVRATAEVRAPGHRRSMARQTMSAKPGSADSVTSQRRRGPRKARAKGSVKSRVFGGRACSRARNSAMYSAVRLGLPGCMRVLDGAPSALR